MVKPRHRPEHDLADLTEKSPDNVYSIIRRHAMAQKRLVYGYCRKDVCLCMFLQCLWNILVLLSQLLKKAVCLLPDLPVLIPRKLLLCDCCHQEYDYIHLCIFSSNDAALPHHIHQNVIKRQNSSCAVHLHFIWSMITFDFIVAFRFCPRRPNSRRWFPHLLSCGPDTVFHAAGET